MDDLDYFENSDDPTQVLTSHAEKLVPFPTHETHASIVTRCSSGRTLLTQLGARLTGLSKPSTTTTIALNKC